MINSSYRTQIIIKPNDLCIFLKPANWKQNGRIVEIIRSLRIQHFQEVLRCSFLQNVLNQFILTDHLCLLSFRLTLWTNRCSVNWLVSWFLVFVLWVVFGFGLYNTVCLVWRFTPVFSWHMFFLPFSYISTQSQSMIVRLKISICHTPCQGMCQVTNWIMDVYNTSRH